MLLIWIIGAAFVIGIVDTLEEGDEPESWPAMLFYFVIIFVLWPFIIGKFIGGLMQEMDQIHIKITKEASNAKPETD